jgi:hypothetical protein
MGLGIRVDPPFLPNDKYDFVIKLFSPILAIISGILFYVYSHKKYKKASPYPLTMNAIAAKKERVINSIAITIGSCLYLIPLFITSINLWAFYVSNEPWEKRYQLVKVHGCGIDYEAECSRLELLDLQRQKRHYIRWYLDKSSLMTLDNKTIMVVGERSYFGFIVNGLKW